MEKRPDCVVLLTHGVGNQERWEFLEEFQEGLFSFLNGRLRDQARLTTEPVSAVAGLDKGYDFVLKDALGEDPTEEPTGRRIRLREFHWADLDGGLRPDIPTSLGLLKWLLKKLAKARFSRLLVPKSGWQMTLKLYIRAGLIFTVLVAAGLFGLALTVPASLLKKRYSFTARWAGFLMEYLGDVRQLEEREVRMAVNQRFNRTINEVIGLDRPRFLVIVSHSLGNVFACDQLKRQLNPAPLPTAWISLGSPLWILPLIEETYLPAQELEVDLELGWYNIYDPLDLLAGPILNPALSNPGDQWYRQRWCPISAHQDYLIAERHLDRIWRVIVRGFLGSDSRAEPKGVRTPRNRRPLALGPYLRHSGPDSLTLWTAHTQPGLHRARLLEGRDEVAILEGEVLEEELLTHLWKFEGLSPETDYRVEFWWLEEETDCWWRLGRRNLPGEPLTKAPTSWGFKTPKPAEEINRRFLFASCNHPRHVHWDGLNGQDFVDRVDRLLDKPGSIRPDGLFLVGDQIYADEWWRDSRYLPWADYDRRRSALKDVYAHVYDRFWHPYPFSRLLRRAPGYMMWDDHDIHDGYGSNASDFSGDEFKQAAREGFGAASEAFRLFQGRGNPAPGSPDDFQFQVDIGPASIFVFDPRTYRNYKQPVDYHPYGPGQMDRFRNWLATTGRTAQVMIVATSSPMAFIRSWRLDLAAEKLPPVMRWAERFLGVEAFDDDWRDQLGCRLNIETRNAIVAGLAEYLAAYPPGEKRGLFLAGDVHVGGFIRVRPDKDREIHLWTASPLTNLPNSMMAKAAKWALPGRDLGRVGGRRLWAEDMVAIAKRNAVILDLLDPPEEGLAPRVRGSLVYESGHGTKEIVRTLG